MPRDMKWDMSDTGDIKIDLKKGLQTLDGNKALRWFVSVRPMPTVMSGVFRCADVLKGVGNKGAEYGKL